MAKAKKAAPESKTAPLTDFNAAELAVPEEKDKKEPAREFRDLDGIYYFLQRGDTRRKPVSFSDMTDAEMDVILNQIDDPVYLRNFCKILAQVIRKIGDQFDIIMKAPDGAQ
jgi:hypothetical protein